MLVLDEATNVRYGVQRRHRVNFEQTPAETNNFLSNYVKEILELTQASR